MRAVCTEARASLRESLRVFAVLAKSPHRLEDLAHRYSLARPGVFPFADSDSATCGNFVRVFASLFLQEAEIRRTSLSLLIDGSAAAQYRNHANLVCHRVLHDAKWLPESWKPHFSSASHSLSTWQSLASHSRLKVALMSHDQDQDLPRIFLVSMSWVGSVAASTIGDHKCALIKHTNDNYQLVQGYCGSPSSGREALFLRQWQQSKHPYSDPLGFSKLRMSGFLLSLGAFAHADAGFDHRRGHHDMFGVDLVLGHCQEQQGDYWPSLSYQEIDDDCIRGSGSRDMAHQLEIDAALPCSSETLEK